LLLVAETLGLEVVDAVAGVVEEEAGEGVKEEVGVAEAEGILR
jgi:hypothetical protein